MRPLARKHVSKRGSARKFRHHVSRTNKVNLPGTMPMRGGYRF